VDTFSAPTLVFAPIAVIVVQPLETVSVPTADVVAFVAMAAVPIAGADLFVPAIVDLVYEDVLSNRNKNRDELYDDPSATFHDV
jgi:hypothetical protein